MIRVRIRVSDPRWIASSAHRKLRSLISVDICASAIHKQREVVITNCDNDNFKIMAVSVALTASSIDVFHQWRLWHGSEARMLFSRSILVSIYQTDGIANSCVDVKTNTSVDWLRRILWRIG